MIAACLDYSAKPRFVFNSFFMFYVRILADALIARMDDKCIDWIRRSGELWPGGDIRIGGNQWLRAAYYNSSLQKVPRENSVRQAVYRVVKKKRLSHSLSLSPMAVL